MIWLRFRAFDSSGSPVEGAKGELVCCSPFPSMPVFFWGDKNNRLYHKTYFEKFPNVWHHGDFCQINPATGGVLMLGRSDATLNPNGIRFGSSEVYNVGKSSNVMTASIIVTAIE